MKKTLMGFVATALAAVMCVGFVGCGGTSAADIEGEEVTAEQWKAAFSSQTFSNYAMSVRRMTEAKQDGKNGTWEVEIESTFADLKEHTTAKSSLKGAEWLDEDDRAEKNYDTEYYVDYSDYSHFVRYVKDEDGKWVEGRADEQAFEVRSAVMVYELLYDLFEYSDEQKGYVFKEGASLPSMYYSERFTIEDPVLKFQNGKLVGVYQKTHEEDESSGDYLDEIIDIVFTYGEQTVELPKVDK